MPILNFLKPKNGKKQKVLLLGSGALAIGQAGEFDYSGSQAVKALTEENLEVIIINPNIASVQTNSGANKKVFLYPVTPFWVEKIIVQERPAAIISSFGGQTALNCVIELEKAGVLKKYGVKVLGTAVEALELSEDRELFAKKMQSINVPMAPSCAATTVEEALETAQKIGYPVVTRSAFALGGLGSGFANTPQELQKLVSGALASCPQVLIEKSLRGFKEIEYEVMRDNSGNTITICNMENFDPMGIHTGDSIVVAPSQTINNIENNMLRDCAIKIADAIGIVGECNVQYALNPDDYSFYVIEINARLSRSSALASKATGYPIAYIAAKVILGFDLLELKNPVTGTTSAFYEPSLDYITLKMPRWDLNKFSGVSKALGTQMKSVGEVMAIGRNFCEALQKAARMVGENDEGLLKPVFKNADEKEIIAELKNPTNLRLFAIYESFKRGKSLQYVHEKTKIDYWFLSHIESIAKTAAQTKTLSKENLLHLKILGFSDYQIAKMSHKKETEIRALRKKLGIIPYVKQIDTTSAEYPTKSNYLYLSYAASSHDIDLKSLKNSIIVLGSGSYRIGSSCEFDWCSVTTANYFKDNKPADSVIINCNPETVSTDFNSSDRLYFEELSFERVLDICDIENSAGVIACVGGQNPNNLITPLDKAGVKILGHSAHTVDMAEDRNKFSKLLDDLGIDQPAWVSAKSRTEISAFVKKHGFPVLIRPSFVLSGTLMNVATDQKSLDYYLSLTDDISGDYPVVISKFILDAKEIEADGVAKNGEVIASFISEHIENAGVHSGDATTVFPAQKIYAKTHNTVKDITRRIAKGLNLNGPFNIQFIAKDNDVKVIECNARASRSFPFISKVSRLNLAELSCKVIAGENVSKIMADESEIPFTGVKAAQFSYGRLSGADPVSGVEMASTGEAGCVGNTFEHAMLLSMEATQVKKPRKGILISAGREKDKLKFAEVAKEAFSMNVPVYATKGTYEYLKQKGFEPICVHWNRSPRAVDIIKDNKVDFVINIPKNFTAEEQQNNSLIRKTALKHACSILTNLEKTSAYLKAFSRYEELKNIESCINL
jgi:carbamoyl-phosphate synthase large subunit